VTSNRIPAISRSSPRLARSPTRSALVEVFNYGYRFADVIELVRNCATYPGSDELARNPSRNFHLGPPQNRAKLYSSAGSPPHIGGRDIQTATFLRTPELIV